MARGERKGAEFSADFFRIKLGCPHPQELDLFRLEDFLTTIICTERFAEAVRRLGYEQDIAFRELPVRGA